MTGPASGPVNGRWRTRANALTLSRSILIVPFAWLITQQYWTPAALIFAYAVISDIYDGKLARKYGEESALGGLLDHGTDALFVTCGTWSLASLQLVNPYLAVLIILAFAQYMFDSRALAGQRLRTSQLGRINGVTYFVLVGTAVGMQLLGWFWLALPVQIAAWVLVFSTLLSMLDRAITYWRHG
ncbi:MAG: CDP-alcohol phosphatidyltransferase family protein [Pseudomonadota bacterium]